MGLAPQSVAPFPVSVEAGAEQQVRLADVVAALSAALDLTEGQPMGHAVRSCLIGMRIAEVLGLPEQERSDLYYALLLKDVGCSSNATRMCQILESDDLAAKRDVKLADWRDPSLSGIRYALRHFQPDAPLWRRIVGLLGMSLKKKALNKEMIGIRCERGATIVRKLGFSARVASAIHALDEHWDGNGFPDGLRHTQIPLHACILSVAQHMDVFTTASTPAEAYAVLKARSGKWFQPEVVRALKPLLADAALWRALSDGSAEEIVLQLEPGNKLPADPEQMDRLCEAFADIVDAKSTYTYRHSVGVTAVAVMIAEELGFIGARLTMVRRAALLHDIGKLGVPNTVLDKPGKLTEEQWALMRRHPEYTLSILERVPGLRAIARAASTHHEKLDGSGYPWGLRAIDLPLEARLLAVADIFQALTEDRPYRQPMPIERALAILAEDVPAKLDERCYQALVSALRRQRG